MALPKNAVASEMVDFLNEAWTPYHAVEATKKRLVAAGFSEIAEAAEWKLARGGKYFFTRNMSSIMAFAIGSEFKAGEGFVVLGAHTDSPCPKLKPRTKAGAEGYVQVAVQPYGGGVWHSWMDRDLGVAGRVIVRRGGGLSHELVRVGRPILRIPTVAIHLDRECNDKFHVNFQNHMAPILCSEIKAQLNKPSAGGAGKKRKAEGGAGAEEGNEEKKDEPHCPPLLALLAKELQCEPVDITDFDLQLCDVQPSCIGGLEEEFVFSGRLDNLASSFVCAKSLVESSKVLKGETGVRCLALFDHEEVGSESCQGAAGTITAETIKRVAGQFAESSGEGAYERSLRRSILVSADMAHAVHPNYPAKHEPNHKPSMHKGSVLKVNANQAYTTDAVTGALWKECARKVGVPFQEFAARSDMRCGSTIGPMVATNVGIRSVDCGTPMWSMHSVRETCGTDDCDISFRHYTSILDNFTTIDRAFVVDAKTA